MNRFLTTAAIGMFSAVASPTPIDWPGGAPMHSADAGAALGPNLSGLAVDGTAGLWAIRDSGSLVHLERSGTGWKLTAGAIAERALHYPGGQGSPDSEAITTVAGDDTAIYVAAERNNDASSTSRNSVLRFETSGSGALTATREWKLDVIFKATPANTGVESLTWIPDSMFISMGYRDASGKVYSPADYPDHGAGLFASAVESRGDIVFLVLRGDGTVTEVGRTATGLDAIMDLSWNSTRQELWATCDSHCKGQAAVLRASDGTFQVVAIVRPPTGMDGLNDEGFAIVPTCTNGTMLAVWSDDSATGGTSLREAPLPCDPIAPLTATQGATASTTSTATTAPTGSAAPATSASSAPAGSDASASPGGTASGSTGAANPATTAPVSKPATNSSRSVWYVGLGALVVSAGAVIFGLRRRHSGRR